MSTIYLKFREIALKHKNKPALFWKDKKGWHKIKFRKLLDYVDRAAEGLFSAGARKGDRIAIFSENRPEWLISDLAINKLRAISVPIHATIKKPLIEYILKNSGSGFLIVSENLFKKHRKFLLNFRDLKLIIVFGRNIAGDGRVRLFSSLFEHRKNAVNLAPRNESEGNLASIIYTSGTTDKPKGVMLTNKNFLSNIESAKKIVKVDSGDRLLSFLPLSHILERTIGSYVPLLQGASIAYAESIKKLSRNFGEVRPTIIIGVPKIFERVYEAVFAEFKNKNIYLKKFFYWSLRQEEVGFLLWLADKIIYRKIRKSFGGSLRFAVSGGASLNEKIWKFFNKIGLVIIEGYGLTETSPLVAANRLGEIKPGTVGRPVSGLKLQIAPDKEILVKGDNVSRGYWRQPELTKKTFFSEGWLRTGDLGFLDKEGFLTIIGRKKEIIVLSNGKNVSPEKIESLINLKPSINQSLVVGHRQRHLCALIVPNYDLMKKKYGYSKSNLREIKKIIQDRLERINKELEPYERIRNFQILTKPFSLEEGELTPTLKVRRKIIEAKHKKSIEKLYL